MKKVFVCGIITVICIVAAVLLRKPMDDVELDYKEVSVDVVSSRVVRSGTSKSKVTSYEVIVNFMGKEYRLKNVNNAYSYREGTTITAYLYNDNLYADVDGVRNSTPIAHAHFAAFICSFVMFLVTLCLWSSVAQKKRRGNG